MGRFLKQENLLQRMEAKDLRLLPLVVKSNYDFYHTELFGHDTILLFAKAGCDLTPMQIEKHKEFVRKAFHRIVVIVFDELASYNVSRLVSRLINFIIPYKQIFIPEIMVNIRKEASSTREVKVIPPMAQVALLWQLERKDLGGKTTAEIAEMIGTTQPTMYRSMNWLSKNGLVQLRGEKTKVVHFCDCGMELWLKAKEHCVSPVEKRVFTDDIVHGIKAGTDALAEMSMLNPDGRKTLALTKTELKNSGAIVDAKYGDTCVEVWRYAPEILADNDCVDPLSLYLSMMESDDERIQIELEHLIKNIQW